MSRFCSGGTETEHNKYSGSCRCAIIGVPWCLGRLSLFGTCLNNVLTSKPLQAKHAETDPQHGTPTMAHFQPPEKGEVLLGGVGTLRYSFPPNAPVQWQPDGLTIHTKKWFQGAGFLGSPPKFPLNRRK